MVLWPILAARRAGSLSGALAWVALCGCSTRADEARVLELAQIRPRNAAGVYLNEALVFHFDADVDPASVHRRSVRIASVDGHSPRGELRVDGDEIRFLPAPVLSPALDDGGYLPDTEYTVRLAGFPFPDGLRSAAGAPLARSIEWRFRTVTVTDPRGGPVFEDRSPEVGRPLQIQSSEPKLVAPTGPIVLEGGEPIDPSSLRAEDFSLRPSNGRNAASPFGDRIPLRAVVADNRDPLDFVSRGRTLVHLFPQSVLAPGDYELRNLAPADLHDFGGHPVWPFSVKRLLVRVQAGSAPIGVGSYVESFLDTALRSPAEVPEADGTALWSGNGRVEIRYPAAAGDGSVGNVSLAGEELRRDLSARSLEVARGETASLGSAPGLVVLRAQRRLTIAGTLVREVTGERPAFEKRESLSDWLAAAHARDLAARGDASLAPPNWTVLIAGGDLTISGRLRVWGPLLLVAGGRIRISGEIECAPTDDAQGQRVTPISFLPKPSDGYVDRLSGGIVFIHWDQVGIERRPLVLGATELPWTLDSPLRNPLRPGERLVYQVLSAAIPPEGGVARWHSGAVIHGFAGNRSAKFASAEQAFRVRFIGEGSTPGSSSVRVDDPALFAEAKSLRLLLELTVFPDAGLAENSDRAGAPSWDPPWIDDVTLSWDREEGGERR
ncbi:MAG: Ig-like domain-containing protein [Planctomycetes bacterium]|nr:Ig-like domain-containing protein [Planctomycetota bacterium]